MYHPINQPFQNDVNPAFGQESQFDLQRLIRTLLSRWYVFLLTGILTCTAGVLYLKITPDTYEASATLLIKADRSNSNLGQNQYLKDGIRLMTLRRDEIENQVGILRSYQMIYRTMQRLDFTLGYYEEDGLKVREFYRDETYPFMVRLDREHVQLMGAKFEVKILSEQEYRLSIETEKLTRYHPRTRQYQTLEQPFEFTQKVRFGEVISHPNFRFSLEKSNFFEWDDIQGRAYFFRYFSHDALTRAYQEKLRVSLREKASIVDVYSQGSVPSKEINFLNELSKTYIQAQLDDKNSFAESTIAFIQEQLAGVSDSLRLTEAKIEDVKRNVGALQLSDASSDSRTLRTLKVKERDELKKALSYYRDLFRQLSRKEDNIPDPITMGIETPTLEASVLRLRDLIQQRTSKAMVAGARDPELIALNQNIEKAREDLLSTVESIVSNTRRQIFNLDADINRLDEELQSLPETEITMMNIQREFSQNDNLFSYLMQRLAEAQISRAATRADSEVLDRANLTAPDPIAPNKLGIMLTAMLAGLLLPAFVLLALDFFNTKVRSEEQIRRLSPIPVLGNIIHKRGKADEGSDLMNEAFLLSPLAETFRYLNINLEHVLESDPKRKVIGVTSTVKGEGKTFTSAHLAAVMALGGRRVLLVGADIRRPRLYRLLNQSNDLGLCDYLSGTHPLEDVIHILPNLGNLHFLPSGPAPLNPVEALNATQLRHFFNEMRERYDYVIVDTPPVGLVSDFLVMARYLDMSLYLVRQNYSEIHFLDEAHKLQIQQRISNLYFVINDVKRVDGITGHARYLKQYGSSYAVKTANIDQ